MFGSIGWGCMLTALLYVIGYAISWIVTCGVFALVCFCLGWEFSWLAATGIWVLLCIARALIK